VFRMSLRDGLGSRRLDVRKACVEDSRRTDAHWALAGETS
jgi:hypothetical protein